MHVLGLDIGGAHLKASDGALTLVEPFPLWRRPHELTLALTELSQRFPRTADVWAVTMTGELCDCFATRAEGVAHILNSAMAAAGPRPVLVWQSSGEFVTVDHAVEIPQLTAAANWHALATWAGRMTPQGRSWLVDMGSTTIDIIPIEDGLPLPVGRTDRERLASGELLYLGARRTPIAMFAARVSLQGREWPLAREVFATALDIGLLLGDVPEDAGCCETANGRPATRHEAAIRLTRQVCSDLDEFTFEEAVEMARQLDEHRLGLIRAQLQRVLPKPWPSGATVLLAGEGEAILRRAWRMSGIEGAEPISLAPLIGAAHSTGACAYALAALASERIEMV